ncbi:MAG: hypothetical protein RLZZ127_447 [Planctomycetota bacterium]|jgi:RNA polymerase sigma-70 factor (ECF subfamily)
MMNTADLISRTARGDHDAWGLLAERHLGTIRTVAEAVCGDGEEAEDAVQEALLRLRAGADGFRPRGDDPEADARRWIKRLAANAAIDQLRRRRRQRAQGLTEIAAPAADAVDQGLAAAVARALSRLTPPARAAVELRYRDGLDGAALAAALGISRVAARVRLHRALALLRRHLAAEGVVAAPILLASLMPPASAGEAVPPAAYAQPVPGSAAVIAGAALALAATAALVVAGIRPDAATSAAAVPIAATAHAERPWDTGATAPAAAATTSAMTAVVPAGGIDRPDSSAAQAMTGATATAADPDSAAARALSTRVRIQIQEDEPLDRALARLARSVGAEIRCTIPASEAMPMALSMDAEVRTILDMVTRLQGTGWRIDNGVIVVGPGSAAAERRP